MHVSKRFLGVATALFLFACKNSPFVPTTVGSIAPDAAALPASPVVGQVLTPTVTVKDASGSPLSNFLVLFAVTQGGGTVSPSSSATGPDGKASTRWTLGATAGLQQLEATAGAQKTSFTVTGIADVASQMAVNDGTGQSAAPSTAVFRRPSVIITDKNGNAKSGVAVTFAVASGGGTATGLSAVTDANGLATVGSWTLGTQTGVNTLTASSSGLTPSLVTFTATAVANAGTATIVVAPGSLSSQPATVATAVGNRPSVVIKDANNNPVIGQSVTFAVASGGGSVTGGVTVTDASGIATVGSWTLGPTAGANTLTATSAGVTGSPVTFTATGQ